METEGSSPRLQVPATCPYPEPDQSSPCPSPHTLKIHLNIIFTFMLRSPKWSLSLRFPHQVSVCTSPLPHSCYMPAHLILLHLITRITFSEQYRSLSSSLCSFLHSPVTSSLLCPNILLNTPLSNTLSLLPSLKESDHVPHPYKTTGKIKVLYILSSISVDSKPEHKQLLFSILVQLHVSVVSDCQCNIAM